MVMKMTFMLGLIPSTTSYLALYVSLLLITSKTCLNVTLTKCYQALMKDSTIFSNPVCHHQIFRGYPRYKLPGVVVLRDIDLLLLPYSTMRILTVRVYTPYRHIMFHNS